MKNYKSIRVKINSIVAIIVFIIFVMQILLFAYLAMYIEKQRVRNVNNIVSQINLTVKEKINLLNKVQSSIISKAYPKNFLMANSDDQKRILKSEIVNYISNIQEYNVDIIYMIMFDNNDKLFSFSNNLITDEYEQLTNSYNQYKTSEKFSDNYNYDFFLLERNMYNETYMTCFVPVTVHEFDTLTSKRIGTVVVCTKVNMDRLRQQTEQFNKLNLTLSDKQKEIPLLTAENNDLFYKDKIVQEIVIQDTPWTVRGVLNESETEYFLKIVQLLMVIETIIIVFFMIVMQKLLSKNITNPIKKIAEYMANYNISAKQELLQINVGYEIGFISGQINEMLDKLKNNTREIVWNQQRLYEISLSEKEALMAALQNQVNPHFIYNTLECIRTIALINDVPDIVEISTAIACIMRYTLQNNTYCLVKEEIDVIEKYLDIMYVRYPDKFSVDIDIAKEVMEVKIIKMIIQPIVENSFKYGLVSNPHMGLLRITGHIDGNILKISVHDNGRGIEKKKYMRIMELMNEDYKLYNDKDGVGLVNINRRIKLNYGSEYGLDIISEEGVFTEVIIKLPFSLD